MTNEINKALEEFNDIVNQLRNQVNDNMVVKEDEDDAEAEKMGYEDEAPVEAPVEDVDSEEMMATDEEAKAESVVYGHNPTGQNRIDGALVGRYDSEFSDFIARKSDEVSTLDLSEENLAKAYEQFKAEKEEERAYDVIKEQFETRYKSELIVEADKVAKSKYDASAEVDALKNEFSELRKSLESNNDIITKQVESVNTAPSLSEDILLKMNNLHELSWEEVNELVREVKSL